MLSIEPIYTNSSGVGCSPKRTATQYPQRGVIGEGFTLTRYTPTTIGPEDMVTQNYSNQYIPPDNAQRMMFDLTPIASHQLQWIARKSLQ